MALKTAKKMSVNTPHTKNGQEILDFLSFIKKYFNWYVIDGINQRVIMNLGLWATRDLKFNGKEPGWHIDRGILFWGNPGSGKDELLRLLNHYLHYLKSKYIFDHKIVWEFSEKFSAKDTGGYRVFSEEGKRNRWYEELARTDENTGLPTIEMAQHMGNKVLIGAELIHITHNAFKNTGIQSHFSTNVEEEKIPLIYGDRVYSRLKYMCNFFKLVGKDRRKEEDPVFLKNINQPPPPPQPRELDMQEHIDNKASLEQHYQDFLNDKVPSMPLAIVYNILVSYDVQVATDEELRFLMESALGNYATDEPSLARKTPTERDQMRQASVWEISRKLAVTTFFQRMKDAGAKSIFNEVDVDLKIPEAHERVGTKGINEILST